MDEPSVPVLVYEDPVGVLVNFLALSKKNHSDRAWL